MAKIKGTKKSDILKGTAEDDIITGFGGDDKIWTMGGHDEIDAGRGKDKVIISSGSSAIVNTRGGQDTVILRAGAESSTIKLGNGRDTINIAVSNQENQTFKINGGAGNDTVAFKGGLELYDVTDSGKVRTVVDANGNTYILSTEDNLTFAGVTYIAPVTPPDRAPVVANAIIDQTANEDQAFSFQFAGNTFTDADGDTLTYSVSGVDGTALPSWLSFDPETRTFSGTPANGDIGSIFVVVTASDGRNTVTDTFKITVANVNDAPTGTATTELAAGVEDTSYVVSAQSLLQGFSDEDGDALSVSGLSASDGATVTDNGDGTWTITTPANFNGAVTLSYTVVDGNGGSIAATQSVTFAAVNDAPVVANAIADQAATEDQAFSFQFASDVFEDVDSASLTYTATLADGSPLPSWLAFDADTRTFSGTPVNGNVGAVSVKVTASDGSASASETFTLTVANVNDAPTGTATAALAAGTEDTSYVVSAQSLLQGFSDEDGDVLSVSGLSASDGATVTDNGDGTWTITTPANFNGAVTLSYSVVDGNGGSIAATQSVTFAAVNDAPILANAIADQAATEDQAFSFQFASNTFSDVDNASLTYTATLADGSPLPSWLAFDADTRTFSGTPANGNVGAVSVKVTASDGSASASETFTLTVANTNDAPTGTATAALAAGTEDTSYVVSAQSLLQGFSDDDGDALSVSGVFASGGATVTDNGDDTWTITPAANFNGVVNIGYTVSDGNGGSVGATQSVTFAAVNDAPVLANAIADQAATEDQAFSFQFASNTFSDVDNASLTYTATLADGSPLPSWLAFDADTRTFSGTPANGNVGAVSVKVTASDGSASASETFTLTVANTNDAPTGTATAALAAGTEDTSYVVSAQSLLQGFSDDDGDALSVSGLSASGGAAVTDNGDGTWTITTPANFNGTVSLSYDVVDGNGGSVVATQSVEFAAVNDAPVVANEISDQTATEGQPFSFQFASDAFEDVDNASLTYTATLENGDALPSWLVFDANTRTFSGTPGDSDSGNIAVRITASDGSAAASDVFTIKVNDVPPPPFPAPTIVAGVLLLNEDYDYDVTEAAEAGKVFVEVDGKIFSFNASDIQSINTQGASSVDIDTKGWSTRDIDGDVNFTNVTFTQAGTGGPFEASFEVGGFGITGNATVNGSAADFFRAAWDYIDDHYSYYNQEINSYGVDIGIKYALYLLDGGEPLTDIVKYQADNNSNGIPQRSQMMHDNLLGNLHEYSIVDKFSDPFPSDAFPGIYTADEIIQRIIDAGLSDFIGVKGDYSDGRQVFSGNEGDIGGSAHDVVRSFDWEHGFDRPDYVNFTSSGTVDAQAIDGSEMYFGDGNMPINYVIERHEGAGIETALKIHFRTGDDILPVLTTSDGVVTFVVPEGYQQNGVGSATGTNMNRSAWSFDYSLVAGLNGSSLNLDDFDFKLKVDMDSSFGVDYQVFDLWDLGSGNTPFVSALGGFTDDDGSKSNIAQNSGNFGFGFLRDNIDDGAGYNFGKGTFDIELIGYRKDTDEVLSNVHIRVVVDSDQFVI